MPVGVVHRHLCRRRPRCCLRSCPSLPDGGWPDRGRPDELALRPRSGADGELLRLDGPDDRPGGASTLDVDIGRCCFASHVGHRGHLPRRLVGTLHPARIDLAPGSSLYAVQLAADLILQWVDVSATFRSGRREPIPGGEDVQTTRNRRSRDRALRGARITSKWRSGGRDRDGGRSGRDVGRRGSIGRDA